MLAVLSGAGRQLVLSALADISDKSSVSYIEIFFKYYFLQSKYAYFCSILNVLI